MFSYWIKNIVIGVAALLLLFFFFSLSVVMIGLALLASVATAGWVWYYRRKDEQGLQEPKVLEGTHERVVIDADYEEVQKK